MNQQNENSITINDEYYYFRSRRIGQGQFGDVYECHSLLKPQKRLCVKVIKFKNQIYRLCNDQISNDIQNELQVAKQLDKLSKDNLIELLLGTYNEATREYFIVMERCDKDLRQYIKERQNANQKFKPTEIISFIQQFVNGYKNLFEQQIIHRDIKPDNILVNIIGSQIQYKVSAINIKKIADFGQSKIYSQLHNAHNFGSPLYCAPEIRFQNQTDKSDVFSVIYTNNLQFGCTLYSFIYFNNFKLFQNGIQREDIIDKYEENPILYLNNDQQFNSVIDLLRSCLIRDPEKRISWPQIFQHPVMESGIITQIKLVEDSLFIQLTNVIMSQNIQRPKRWSNKSRDVRITRFINLLKLKQMLILKINEDLNQVVSVYSQFFQTGLIALVTLYYRYEYGFISNNQTFIPLKKRKYFIVNYQEADFALYFMLHKIKERSRDLEKGRKHHFERIQQLEKKIHEIMNLQIQDYVNASLQNLSQINDNILSLFLQENLNRIKDFKIDLDIDDVIAYLRKIYNEKLLYDIQYLQQLTPQKQPFYDLLKKEIQVLFDDLESKYEQMKYNLIHIPQKVEDMINN